jgi:ATP-dependent DNA helicase RecG
LLFTESASSKVEERLKFFEGCLDGFKLAEKDLELRGPGEVYGTEQSGMMHLRLVKLTDQTIIKKSREVAKELAPEIQNYPNILKRVKKWKEVVHLE